MKKTGTSRPARSAPTPVAAPTAAMRALVRATHQALCDLFAAAVDCGGRNEWISLLCAAYDARTRTHLPIERAPDPTLARVVTTPHGTVLVAMIPRQVYDHPGGDAGYFAPAARVHRETDLGNDLLTTVYARGEIFAGALAKDFDAYVSTPQIDPRARAALDSILARIAPDLRAVLPVDAHRLGLPADAVAYRVTATAAQDATRPLTLTELCDPARREIALAVDTFTIDRLRATYADATPALRDAVDATVAPGSFRTVIQAAGVTAVYDYDIAPSGTYRARGAA
jgi:hypothetical protein